MKNATNARIPRDEILEGQRKRRERVNSNHPGRVGNVYKKKQNTWEANAVEYIGIMAVVIYLLMMIGR